MASEEAGRPTASIATVELRHAIEAASRSSLPNVTALLWRAFGEQRITEEEAESLSAQIEARTLTGRAPRLGRPSITTGPHADQGTVGHQDRLSAARRSVGSRPRTDQSIERRRRWASSGRLPPGLAARFTLAEQAVLALVAAETTRRGDCRLAVGHVAAVVGVAETTVRNAIREAAKLGLLTVEERRITGFRNDTNIVRIVAAEWTAWLRLGRKAHPALTPSLRDMSKGGGCKSPKRTHTQGLILSESGKTAPSQSCRRAAGDPDRSGQSRIRQGGRKAGAMR